MKKRIVLALSGGMDSSSLLGTMLGNGNEVTCVSFRYSSKHNPYELRAARGIADHYRVPLVEINLTGAFNSFESALLTQSHKRIPEGHYQAETMKLTVVPCRNVIFIATLTGFAESIKASVVAIGVHAGDHAIYPDCRPPFIFAMRDVVDKATEGRVELAAPFLYRTKAQILEGGLQRKVPYQLTRTCYQNQEVACGRCGACQERIEAFELSKTMDPLDYVSREIMPK